MPSTAAAPTATLTADPSAIDLGQSVVLNWRTTDATVVTIDGVGEVPVNGTQTVSPSSSTNFHLIAKGDGGTTEANVRVTVRVPQAPAATGDTGDMGSEAAFHQNVQDIFFDYDSYDLRPDAQTSATDRRYLPQRAYRHQACHRRLLRRAWIGGIQPGTRREPRQRRQDRTGQRRCQRLPHSRHQLRQGEAVLHRSQRELLAAEPPRPVLHGSARNQRTNAVAST